MTWTFVGQKQNATNFVLTILQDGNYSSCVAGKINNADEAMAEALSRTGSSEEEKIRKASRPATSDP